ncbi:hypothetical protein HAX54_014983, partial [Datura stramonium]|nr:hypothetical protein [Datura stramonium]
MAHSCAGQKDTSARPGAAQKHHARDVRREALPSRRNGARDAARACHTAKIFFLLQLGKRTPSPKSNSS